MRDSGWCIWTWDGSVARRELGPPSIITSSASEQPLPSPHLLKMQGEVWEGSRKLASNIPKQASPLSHWGLQVRIPFSTTESYKAMIPNG